MDRTLAVGQAVAAMTGARLDLPEGWELVEIDLETGEPVTRPEPAGNRPRPRRKRHDRRR